MANARIDQVVLAATGLERFPKMAPPASSATTMPFGATTSR